ncbi:serine-threonine kinase receptor-associated protein-like [Plakobranchus ocellatus]|uniref:ADAM10 endopeptidase n=1 Tax=Plakobranchus ocellatus TaxID=259542 RepID=A0AAV4B572_9GAST|nr:serine-threonine kinase receptor-associated protein-like [Plakobranchus ocellatus]
MITAKWTWLLPAFVVIFSTSLTCSTDATRLNDYILDYEPLEFDHAHLHEKHNRIRRDVDSALRWNFKAYGRTFKLHLKPDRSVFSHDHTLDFDGHAAQPIDTNFFYEGYLTDVPNSKVHMSVRKNHLWGQMTIPGHTTYFIEPAQHHFANNNTSFHTIIYPESRMNLDPYRHQRKNSASCATETYAKLREMAQPVDDFKPARHKREAENPYSKYSADLNNQESIHPSHTRFRRAAGELKDSANKTCFMQLRADKLLYDHFLQKYNNDVERTKEVILNLFASHIKVLSQIYLSTVFESSQSSVKFTGINFVLQRSTIISSCGGAGGYNQGYCEDLLDVSNYLDLTSEEDHSTFCLVHTFTYRDFTGGTLGLAWVADPGAGNAGVCGKRGKIKDTNNRIVERSLNTGIVTLINFNQEVPTRVSQITFAHEVGHNFGAQHDKTDQCAPFGTSQPDASSGNYIMFPSAIPGDMPNNKKFSSCSRSSIALVLQSVGGVRTNCFQGSDQAFCGNNIVEDGEECDCGYKIDCTDTCCNGRDEQATDCKLTNGAQCSTDDAKCPQPSYKENFTTFCNDYSAVCEQGQCQASVCFNIGWQECFKTSEDGVSEDEMCFLSCRKDATSECISSTDDDKIGQNTEFADLLNRIKNNRNSSSNAIKLAPGSSCDNFKGYCDVFSKCRKVDAEGPFKQLTDLIFNPVTFGNIRDWIRDNWWAVLLMCVGAVVFMGVFVFVFKYDTPSQDPSKKRHGQQGAGNGRSSSAGGRRVGKPKSRISPIGNSGNASHLSVLHGHPPRGHDNAGYSPDNGVFSGQTGRGQGRVQVTHW